MDAALEARQLVPRPPSTTVTAVLSAKRANCTPFTLPAYGVISIDSTATITLTQDAIFKPLCTVEPGPAIIANGASNTGLTIDDTDTGPHFSDFRDPFYASTFPQCYALAATTIIAYMLVIMLVITPRSFLDGGVVFLGRRGHGFSKGPSGGLSIGGRPWLQKVAALTVAISLTIATVETFRVAEEQYFWGIENARGIQDEVMKGTVLKVIRLISDTFLWLAQAQTLIRLFPRQREKAIIKWTAFALISLDVVFGACNSFLYDTKSRPGSFVEPVPALSYLFQLSLGVLYAAWVIYYAITKKQYAFYHQKMRNMLLVSLLSVVSLLVPVVFFVLDISKPELASWGDYVRWVGAAAASVVVWEWVERIEALEREEKKDGILGREVFDGDEMIEASASDVSWPRKRRHRKDGGGEGGDRGPRPPPGGASGATTGRAKIWPAMSSIASRYGIHAGNSGQRRESGPAAQESTQNERSATQSHQPPLWPSRPAPAVTPVSRTDTTSPDSTVYRVHYRTLGDATSPPPQGSSVSRSNSIAARSQYAVNDTPIVPFTPAPASTPLPGPEPTVTLSDPGPANSDRPPSTSEHAATASPAPTPSNATRKRWHNLAAVTPLFKKTSRDPPADVARHTRTTELTASSSSGPRGSAQAAGSTRWDLRGRLEDFAATQADKLRERIRPTVDTDRLPVTVIPAPARPDVTLLRLMDEEGAAGGTTIAASGSDRTTRSPSMGERSDARPGSLVTSPISPTSGRSGQRPYGPSTDASGGHDTLARTHSRNSIQAALPLSASQRPPTVLSHAETFRTGTGSAGPLRSVVIPAPPRPESMASPPPPGDSPRARNSTLQPH